jgi:hypothetical protein
MTALQDEFAFGSPTLAQRFDTWVHTPAGGEVANRFIRLAIGLHRRGLKVGSKCIWERLRWHYEVARVPGDRYALNNVWTPYMARFAMDRAPELRGYFDLRAVGKPQKTRPVFVKAALVVTGSSKHEDQTPHPLQVFTVR